MVADWMPEWFVPAIVIGLVIVGCFLLVWPDDVLPVWLDDGPPSKPSGGKVVSREKIGVVAPILLGFALGLILLGLIALGFVIAIWTGGSAHAQEACRTVDDIERTVTDWQAKDPAVVVERIGGVRTLRLIEALNSSVPPRTDWSGAGVIAAAVGGKIRVAVVGVDGDVCHAIVLSPRAWQTIRSKSADEA